MSDQVISLSSSDEEENAEPPPKKSKTQGKNTLNLSECTLTIVPSNSPPTAPKTIETVSLDSDDEVCIENSELTKKKSETTGDTLKKNNGNVTSTDKPVALISLTDDDDDEDVQLTEPSTTEKPNGKLNGNATPKPIVESVHETVSIDDSDNEVTEVVTEVTEVDTNKEIDKDKSENILKSILSGVEKTKKSAPSIIIDDSDEETEKENHCENAPVEAFPVLIEKTSADDIIFASTSKDEMPNEMPSEMQEDIICNQPNIICKDLFVSLTRICLESCRNNGYDHSDSNTNSSDSHNNEFWDFTKDVSNDQDDLAEAKNLFKNFIRMVEEKTVDSSFEEILPKKVPIIKKYFNKSGTYVNDKEFKNILSDSIQSIKKSSTSNGANVAVLAFHKVFENLKSHMAETTIVIEEDHLPKIKKLEQTIKLLRKRIHQLEVAEVNWDDDEDSAYIMLDRCQGKVGKSKERSWIGVELEPNYQAEELLEEQPTVSRTCNGFSIKQQNSKNQRSRYQARLKKVYAKYCQYIKRNPYSGRATYDRINFVNSRYNEINQALTKKYKNSLVFPSYHELESYITKVVKKEKLNLSEGEIRVESKKCFKVLGNILQKKRRQELYDSHLDFVDFAKDPATKDISLENTLKKNYTEGKEKIDKLYQKFVEKQERGEDTVSDEESSSKDSEEEVDNNQNNKTKKNVKKNNKIKGKNIKNSKRKNHKSKEPEVDTQEKKEIQENEDEESKEETKEISEKQNDEDKEPVQQDTKEVEKDKEDVLTSLNLQSTTDSENKENVSQDEIKSQEV